MTAMRSIVAATDLSGAARHAAERAAWLARDEGAALTLVHALRGSLLDDSRAAFGAEPSIVASLRDQARATLDRQARELEARFGGAVDVRWSARPRSASRDAPPVRCCWCVSSRTCPIGAC